MIPDDILSDASDGSYDSYVLKNITVFW